MTEKKKTYEAVLLLGQETDTQDTTGEVLARCPVNVSEEEVRRTAASFIGPQKQVPPMYSALKVEGKKLYELARAGKEVERPARDIQIDELTMNWIKLPRVGMTVTCSKGTYIRTLCYDLGKALGCGGCMEKLTRTRVERFLIQDSLTLSQIETLRDENRVEEIILPIEVIFDGPRAIANEAGNKKLINGNPVAAEDFAFILREDGQAEPLAPEALPKTGLVRVYSADRKFLGLYEYEERRRFWKPKKMFPT